MGEEFLIAKKARFDHQRDQAVEKEFKTENLLSLLPDVRTAVYRCALTSADHRPDVGDRIVVAPLRSGTVQVVYQNAIIGHVLSVDAKKLIASFAQSSIGMLAGQVQHVGKINSQFSISIDLPAQ